jgi:energy-coupling factor transporter transmembrane protein EcfT
MQKNTGLGWLSPTPRLIVFVLLTVAFTIGRGWAAVLIALAIGMALLIAGGKYPKAALYACLSAAALTFLGYALFARGDVLVKFLFFQVSLASTLYGLRSGLHILAILLPAVDLIAVTSLPEYLIAFRGLRVPAVVEMGLAVADRKSVV